jgi:hypothetical protein
MCSPSCFDWWSRLSAVADARQPARGLSRRSFLATAAVPLFRSLSNDSLAGHRRAAEADHGYRSGEVAKVLGGNAQRVFRQVQAASRPS